MIHAFAAGNKYYLADGESGAVFGLDRLAYLLARRREDGGEPDSERELSRFSADEIRGAERELAGLQSLFGGERRTARTAAAAESSPLRAGGGLKALCLNVSHACNLRCGYCFADGGAYGGGAGAGAEALMPPETARAAVDFLVAGSGRRRNLEIDFFGGEPLLAFDTVKATVEYARSIEGAAGKRFNFTLTTNGIDLDREKADFLNREFYNVVVSIDGRKDVHDAVRPGADGRGMYGRTVENARMLIAGRGGKSYYIRGTFTRKNLDFALDARALVEAGFEHISLEPVVLPENHPLAIREEDLPAVCAQYDALAEYYARCAEAGHPFDFFHFRLDLEGAPCREKILSGCGAGRNYLAIAPNGGIYPCHRYDGKEGYLMGNVRAAPAELNADVSGRFARCNIESNPECAECWAKYYCGGGCNANADFFSENGKPYKIACTLLKKRTELAIALRDVRKDCPLPKIEEEGK